MQKIIGPRLREEIQLKADKIAGSPEAYDQRKKLVIEDLRSIGDVYSFWIENPDLRIALVHGNRQPETVKKMARKGISAVHNGWYFLSQMGQYGAFLNVFNEDKFQRLNGLVVPEEDGCGRFRGKDVTLNIPDYTPTSWERVPEKVKELFATVREKYADDPLEASILMHLGVAAIQPFLKVIKDVGD